MELELEIFYENWKQRRRKHLNIVNIKLSVVQVSYFCGLWMAQPNLGERYTNALNYLFSNFYVGFILSFKLNCSDLVR